MVLKVGKGNSLKNFIGEFPFLVDIYWYLLKNQKPWSAHFKMDGLKQSIKEAVCQADEFSKINGSGKKLLVFSSLHYWIEYSAMVSLALVGHGHDVCFCFLPYAEWNQEISKFDLRKQELYAREILKPAKSLMKIISYSEFRDLPDNISTSIMDIAEQVSILDLQYTLQVEDVNKEDPLYQLRFSRNLFAAYNLAKLFELEKPDTVVVPNGTIQEMGVAYKVARLLDIDVVTFEFGDQTEHIWIAKNDEIMHQNTDELWNQLGDKAIDLESKDKINRLFSARRNAELWGNLSKRWQKSPSKGKSLLKEKLSLDDRPVVLLATNVLGDSLTLERQVFSKNMAEWIEQTVRFFFDKTNHHLIIRIHPGEAMISGLSMLEVINKAIPDIPDHIHVIKPKEDINTYDLVSLADLGLTYTTTVGLEMAMSGLPVIVSGNTHYRRRGFTFDPGSWDEYFGMLSTFLENPLNFRMDNNQIELAWRYAYLFFFKFPMPFPWHVVHAKEDFEQRNMQFVLSSKGNSLYGRTFDYLAGYPINWTSI